MSKSVLVFLALSFLLLTECQLRAQRNSDRIVGVWSTATNKWEFRSDGTFRIAGRNTGTWKTTSDGVAVKYSGASVWINLKFVGDDLVDQDGFVGRARLKKAADSPKRPTGTATITFDEFAPETITSTAESLAENDKYKSDENGTKCNFFVQDFAEKILGSVPDELAGARANEMFDSMEESPDWYAMNVGTNSSATFETAQKLANAGSFVIVAYRNPDAKKSGHVAIVVPTGKNEAIPQSGTWGGSVPYIAQAGTKVFAKDKLSFGFNPKLKEHMKVFVRSKRPSR